MESIGLYNQSIGLYNQTVYFSSWETLDCWYYYRKDGIEEQDKSTSEVTKRNESDLRNDYRKDGILEL